MNRMSQLMVGVLSVGCLSGLASAVITPLDSSSFSKKFEMTTAGPNELDPTANTSEWNATVDTAYGATASLSGGYLEYDSSVAINRYAYWESVTEPSLITNASGGTVEARVRLDAVSDSGNEADKAFVILMSDGTTYGALTIGLGTIYFTGAGTLTSIDNTDGYHTFRMARDASSTKYQIWRDGVQIGTDLDGISSSSHTLYFADGSGGYGSKGSVDYVRFTAGGYSPAAVPEPTSLGLLAVGGLLMSRRRGRTA